MMQAGRGRVHREAHRGAPPASRPDRRRPDRRDAGRNSAGKLSEYELVRFCLGVLAVGHETTANSINMSFVALCQHPGELARLRADPGLIPAAAEELLRYVIAGCQDCG
jgi:cytochrome P450